MSEHRALLRPLKIVITGPRMAGKSIFLYRFIRNVFEIARPTMGVSIHRVEVPSHSFPTQVRSVNVWDVSGIMRLAFTRIHAYPHANAIILGFDVSDLEWQLQIQSFVKEIHDTLGTISIPILLVGMQADRITAMKEQQLMDQISQRFAYPIIFTSARTGRNIETTFQLVCALALDHNIQPDQPYPLFSTQYHAYFLLQDLFNRIWHNGAQGWETSPVYFSFLRQYATLIERECLKQDNAISVATLALLYANSMISCSPTTNIWL